MDEDVKVMGGRDTRTMAHFLIFHSTIDEGIVCFSLLVFGFSTFKSHVPLNNSV